MAKILLRATLLTAVAVVLILLFTIHCPPLTPTSHRGLLSFHSSHIDRSPPFGTPSLNGYSAPSPTRGHQTMSERQPITLPPVTTTNTHSFGMIIGILVALIVGILFSSLIIIACICWGRAQKGKEKGKETPSAVTVAPPVSLTRLEEEMTLLRARLDVVEGQPPTVTSEIVEDLA